MDGNVAKIGFYPLSSTIRSMRLFELETDCLTFILLLFLLKKYL